LPFGGNHLFRVLSVFIRGSFFYFVLFHLPSVAHSAITRGRLTRPFRMSNLIVDPYQ
jgi:hypothetical protein